MADLNEIALLLDTANALHWNEKLAGASNDLRLIAASHTAMRKEIYELAERMKNSIGTSWDSGNDQNVETTLAKILQELIDGWRRVPDQSVSECADRLEAVLRTFSSYPDAWPGTAEQREQYMATNSAALLSLDETTDLMVKVDDFLVDIAKILETGGVLRVTQFTETQMALWTHLKSAGLIMREAVDREADSPWDLARFRLTYKGQARLERIKKSRGEETEQVDKILGLPLVPSIPGDCDARHEWKRRTFAEHYGTGAGRFVMPPVCLEHAPVQHRDGKPPWCKACGWTSALPATSARKIKEV